MPDELVIDGYQRVGRTGVTMPNNKVRRSDKLTGSRDLLKLRRSGNLSIHLLCQRKTVVDIPGEWVLPGRKCVVPDSKPLPNGSNGLLNRSLSPFIDRADSRHGSSY